LIGRNVIRRDVRATAAFVHSGHDRTTCRLCATGFRLQHDHGFHHRERRRIGRSFRAAGLAEDALDFREPHQDAVLHLQQPLGLSHRNTGSVVGMNSSDASSSGGMNSEPSRSNTGTVTDYQRQAPRDD
jgi:hypothetical protein